MNSRLYFMTAFVFKIAASQNFTHSTLTGLANSFTLRCVTVDLGDTILFKLDNDYKGGCFVGDFCSTGITGYEQPTQLGTNITEMVIKSCSTTRDTGMWTCAYGGSTSESVTIADCGVSGDVGGGDAGNKEWMLPVGVALICDLIGDLIITILIYLFLVKRGIFLHKCADGYKSKVVWVGKALLIEAIIPVICTVLVCVLTSSVDSEYKAEIVIPVTVVLAVVFTVGFTIILTVKSFPLSVSGTNGLKTCKVEEEAIVGSKIILLQDQLKSMKSVKHIEWKYKGSPISGNSNTKFQAGTVDVPTLLITGITENDGGRYACNIVLADDSEIKFIVDLRIKGIPRPQPDGEEGTLLPVKETNARHLKTGGALLDRPENMSQQTDEFDSTNLPRPNRLPPVEMVNNPSSADALDGENTDRTQKERKKKKKKKKDEGTSNPVDV